MLVDERASFVGVALEADGILRGSCADLPGQKTSVGIVAVIALHEAFVHTVMEGAIELLLHFLVAAIAKQRRLFLHQELAFLRMVRRVAVYAAHVVLQVRGTSVVAVLLSVRVASQAACADFLGRGILECKDLRFIAATVDVSFPWTVACFAAVPLWTFLRVQRRHIVR